MPGVLADLEARMVRLERTVNTLLSELRARGLDHLPKTVSKKPPKISAEARAVQLKKAAAAMRQNRWPKKTGKPPKAAKKTRSSK